MRDRETVGEAAARLLPEGASFDTALPQPWVDFMTRTVGFDPRGSFVWLYDRAAGCMGRPFPLSRAACRAVRQYNTAAGTCFPSTFATGED